MSLLFSKNNIHEEEIYNISGISLIDFIEASMKSLMSLSINELKEFDIEFVLDLIRRFKPIYSDFDEYRKIVNIEGEPSTGYIVLDVSEIKRDFFDNTLDLYSCDSSKKDGIRYDGTFFAGNNLNVRNILNHKLVYINSSDRNNLKWFKSGKSEPFEATPFQLINFILGFIYINTEVNSLVDNLDIGMMSEACFDFKSD